jgi:hypothetical protein
LIPGGETTKTMLKGHEKQLPQKKFRERRSRQQEDGFSQFPCLEMCMYGII